VAFEHNGQVWFWVPEQGEEPLPVDELENVQREHIPYCRPQDQVIIHPVQVYPKDSNELHAGDLAQMAFQVEQGGMVQPTPPSKSPKRTRRRKGLSEQR